MRASPAGHAATNQFSIDLLTVVAAAVAGDAKTHDQIAYSAGMTTADLEQALTQGSMPLSIGNSIMAGLTNPNKRVGPSGTVAAPFNTVAPTAPTGTKTNGQTLTAVTGTWIGDATITFTYQWIRHASATDKTDGVNIAAATSATYVLAAGDVGKFISVMITATNPAGASPQGPVESVRTTVIS